MAYEACKRCKLNCRNGGSGCIGEKFCKEYILEKEILLKERHKNASYINNEKYLLIRKHSEEQYKLNLKIIELEEKIKQLEIVINVEISDVKSDNVKNSTKINIIEDQIQNIFIHQKVKEHKEKEKICKNCNFYKHNTCEKITSKLICCFEISHLYPNQPKAMFVPPNENFTCGFFEDENI